MSSHTVRKQTFITLLKTYALREEVWTMKFWVFVMAFAMSIGFLVYVKAQTDTVDALWQGPCWVPSNPAGVAIGPPYCASRHMPGLYGDTFGKIIGALILGLVVLVVAYVEDPWRGM